MFYYGCKIHTMASVRPGKMAFPKSMIITTAEDNDLTAFKRACGNNIFSKVILGDKIYFDKEYFNAILRSKFLICQQAILPISNSSLTLC